MRKLKLDMDSLVVQTFETVDSADSRGTVNAHESVETTGGPWLCPALCESFQATCELGAHTCDVPPNC